MRIEDKTYLDFDDVLIRPKRTPLESRKQVKLEREFKFLHSEYVWKGIPIIASNMDTVGTFEMASELIKYNMLTAIHKFYMPDEWENLYEMIDTENMATEDYIIPTIGMSSDSLDYLHAIFEEQENKEDFVSNFVMVDVANGYTERFNSFISEVREEEPEITIIAGNVATPEAVEALLFAGADIVKIGIGPSKVCFDRNTIVKTKNGEKKISDISVDDLVLTHTGEYKKVINLFENKNPSGKRVIINGTSSTENHEYYVLNKKYADIVNDENINEYAEWVEAKKIDKNKYFLIKNNNFDNFIKEVKDAIKF